MSYLPESHPTDLQVIDPATGPILILAVPARTPWHLRRTPPVPATQHLSYGSHVFPKHRGDRTRILEWVTLGIAAGATIAAAAGVWVLL